MPAHWLVKSEPDAFSWDQQVANGVEPWTGVRNALAAKHLRAMRKGDLAFFYHSNIGKEIVGVVEVAREAYPDPTDETGRWVCVDMKAVGPVPKPVALAAIKEDPRLADLALVGLDDSGLLDDHVDLLVRGLEHGVERVADGVGEHHGARHEGDAEDDGDAGECEAHLVRPEVLRGQA